MGGNMTKDIQKLERNLLLESSKLLKECFKRPIRIKDMYFLSEPDRRNILARLILEDPQKSINSVILKQSLSHRSHDSREDVLERFAREYAGLKLLSESDTNYSVPRFFGGNQSLYFILLEDLGSEHISLVDSLTKSDADKASLALKRFTKSLAHFHMASIGRLKIYDQILNQIYPGRKTIQSEIKWKQNDLLPKLERACRIFELPFTDTIKREAISVIEEVFMPGPFHVLTHGDICPDNVFDHEDKDELQLIDFEWAKPGSSLLDATYFKMNFPTCWCAKALPEKVIIELDQLYRDMMAHKIPESLDDHKYYHAYTHACGFWLLRAMPFVKRIMEKNYSWSSGPVPSESLWKPEQNLVRPRFISRLEAFIQVSETHNLLPHLRLVAKQMLEKAYQKWYDACPLDMYPAFSANL